MNTVFFQLEVTFKQPEKDHQVVIINRFKKYESLKKFLKETEAGNESEIKNVTIKRINTKIL